MIFRVKLVLKWGRGRNTFATVAVISIHGLKGVAGSCTSKLSDVTSIIFSYYASQKKTFEINPRHPLIKDMLRRVKVNK